MGARLADGRAGALVALVGAARTVCVLTGAGLMLATGGCLGGASGVLAPLDPDDQALVQSNRGYPRWADFPATSRDLPTAGQIAGRVDALGLAAQALAAETRRIAWTLDDPAGFDDQIRRRVNLAAPSALTAQTHAEIEAFAAALRARAEAPPPVDRHR